MAVPKRHMLVTRSWSVSFGYNDEHMAIEEGDILRVIKENGPWLFVKNITGSPDLDRLISLPPDSRDWIPDCRGWVPTSHCTLYLKDVPDDPEEERLWKYAHYFGSAEAEVEEERPPMPTRAPPRLEKSDPPPPPRSKPAVYPPPPPPRQEGVLYEDGITLKGVFYKYKQPPPPPRDPPDTPGQADWLAMGKAADLLTMAKAKAQHRPPKVGATPPKFADGAIESKGTGTGKDEGEEGTNQSQFLTARAGIQAQRPEHLDDVAWHQLILKGMIEQAL